MTGLGLEELGLEEINAPLAHDHPFVVKLKVNMNEFYKFDKPFDARGMCAKQNSITPNASWTTKRDISI